MLHVKNSRPAFRSEFPKGKDPVSVLETGREQPGGMVGAAAGSGVSPEPHTGLRTRHRWREHMCFSDDLHVPCTLRVNGFCRNLGRNAFKASAAGRPLLPHLHVLLAAPPGMETPPSLGLRDSPVPLGLLRRMASSCAFSCEPPGETGCCLTGAHS